MAHTILVVDDEPKIVRLVRAYLEQSGYRTLSARSGREALDLYQTESPSLVVLDLMLPDLDGMDVAREIRRIHPTPIIMLTARTEDVDRVAGLEIGADDYVVKPFNPRELLARVRAVLRRTEGAGASHVIRSGPLSIDPETREVRLEDRLVELTPMEFELLRILAEHPGHVYGRAQLIAALYGQTYASTERTVDTHVKNLRRKLEPDPQRPRYVLTVHGVGYKFRKAEP